jgi:hypothetical protein
VDDHWLAWHDLCQRSINPLFPPPLVPPVHTSSRLLLVSHGLQISMTRGNTAWVSPPVWALFCNTRLYGRRRCSGTDPSCTTDARSAGRRRCRAWGIIAGAGKRLSHMHINDYGGLVKYCNDQAGETGPQVHCRPHLDALLGYLLSLRDDKALDAGALPLIVRIRARQVHRASGAGTLLGESGRRGTDVSA